jgi:hypothetical protein
MLISVEPYLSGLYEVEATQSCYLQYNNVSSDAATFDWTEIKAFSLINKIYMETLQSNWKSCKVRSKILPVVYLEKILPICNGRIKVN